MVRVLDDVVRVARRVTVRQAVAIAVAVVLTISIVAAAVLELFVVTTALFGILGMLLFAAVVHLRRTWGREAAALRVEVSRLTERVEHTQRQVVAAVEDQRLLGMDRHREVLHALGVSDADGPGDP